MPSAVLSSLGEGKLPYNEIGGRRGRRTFKLEAFLPLDFRRDYIEKDLRRGLSQGGPLFAVIDLDGCGQKDTAPDQVLPREGGGILTGILSNERDPRLKGEGVSNKGNKALFLQRERFPVVAFQAYHQDLRGGAEREWSFPILILNRASRSFSISLGNCHGLGTESCTNI